MALIGTISGSFDSTGSFGSVFVTGEVTSSTPNVATIGRVEAKTQIVAGGVTFNSFTSGTSGTSGATGGAGAQGGTGGIGAQGGQGGTGAAGGTGGTGSTGNQGAQGATGGGGAQGGTGGIGAQGGTGGAGAQGPTGSTGAQGATGGTGSSGPGGAQGGTGGTGGTGAGGSQGAGGGGGGTGGTGGAGAQGNQGGQGPQGPTGTDASTIWDDNQTLSWTGMKLLTGPGESFKLKFDGIATYNYGLVVRSKDRPLHTQNFGGTGLIWFYGSGNTYPSSISDRRSKKFLTPISGTLDAKKELEHLDGKLTTFTKIHYDSASFSGSDPAIVGYDKMDWNTHTGYVAQEVLELTGSAHARNFVHRINQDENKVDEEHGYYRFDYNGLNTISTQALIDIEKDVTDLEARVTTLEG